VRGIIHNLKMQHKELTRITMDIVPRLEPATLASDASSVRKNLSMLTGILKVHLAMEDKSFYPFLLAHRDGELRKMAEDFLAQREEIQTRFLDYTARWMEKGAIEKDASTFIEETRAVLMELGTRMLEEDREFHPLILQRDEVS
jgi:hemerythrin-like domain-containing protein